MIGTLFFLIPSCLLLAYLSWPFFMQAYAVGELSSNAGGLVRWPIKVVIPAGFVVWRCKASPKSSSASRHCRAM